MFDPRMMAPDGSSYSRHNVLATAPTLAPASPMTPPDVQTMTPQPQPQANALQGWRDIRGRFGGFGPGMGQMGPLFGGALRDPSLWGQVGQNWQSGMQDWRAARPTYTGERPTDWRQQMMDWQQQRPSWMNLMMPSLQGS